MPKPNLQDFIKLTQRGNVVPVSLELLADMETPVSVFKKLDAESDYAFLLESVEQGEKLGRYSFLGADPAVVLRVSGEHQEVLSSRQPVDLKETPIATLRSLMAGYKPAAPEGTPPFFGGAVGFLSYDTVRYFERIPARAPDVLGLPDCVIMVVDTLIAFDHVRHRMLLIANAIIGPGQDPRVAYEDAVARLEALRLRLKRPRVNGSSPAIPRPAAHDGSSLEAFRDLHIDVRSNTTRDEFCAMVNRAKEYITAGDIFQVVLSQRFGTRVSCPPFDVYRALRAVNPSPYMFYLKCGAELQLAGSSPEILAKLREGKVTVRPIAGTRPRGANPEDDLLMERDLLADDKERAEHVMLVDLGRNDVGRVSQFASVRVSDFMTIERYSHVMHIVSNVTGDIRPDRDALDVLASCFPAGTLSGAPKIRAMEIIDELEKQKRGPYGGTVVYMAYDGDMDSCITIRTAVIRGQEVFVQAGAGIVADSDPDREYVETVNKARGMLKAIDMAEQGLD